MAAAKPIEIRRGAGGKSAFIAGTRVRVSDVARLYELFPEEELVLERIQRSLPHLTLPQIQAALDYWRAHADEIKGEILEEESILEKLSTRALSFALFLDENVDVELAALLGRAGYDVLTTQDAGRASRSLSDEDQLAFATDQGRAIFSHNAKDFEPLARQWAELRRSHMGIVLSDIRPTRELYERFLLLLQSYPTASKTTV